MAITFTQIHGFADLPDAAFNADNPAFGDLIQSVAENSEFAFAHLEIFQGMYVNGETVPLPVSGIDGYVYSRDELLYLWNPELSTNRDTGWIQSGSGSLFFCAWAVDQMTGGVFSLEWYRNNGSGGSRTQTNDGQIRVYTVAQRQRKNVILSTTPVYAGVGTVATDQPFTQAMAQAFNDDAKLAAINHEVFDCGEFANGQIVSLSSMVSSYDAYHYSYAEAKFIACWRWTTDGYASQVTQPPEQYGQMGPFICSVDATGHVATQVITNDNDGNVTFPSNYGRVAVFAFCQRSATPGSLALANGMAEIAFTTFSSGKTLRASNLLQLQKNINEALLTPEYFGPTVYADGNTVSLPTSPIDDYAYARNELSYIWCWSNTTNFPPNGGRLPVFYGAVNQSSGAVSLWTWRLGSHYDDPHNDLCRITVITVARRGMTPAGAVSGTTTSSPGDVTTSTLQPGVDIDAYAIAFDMGGGRISVPGISESLLKHAIPSNLSTVTLASGLSGSIAGCRTAATAPYVITIKKNGSSVGSINFASSATTGTFTLSASQTLVPGDILEFVGAVTPDATITGIFFTISGLRNQ